MAPVGMPAELLPSGKRRGRLPYTVQDQASGAKIEVLLKHRAFRVVCCAEKTPSGILPNYICGVLPNHAGALSGATHAR